MNTILRKITNNCYNNVNSKYFERKGNYEVKRDSNFIIHKYFGNTICIVDLNKKQFRLYSHGYNKSRLTSAQLNYLEDFYLNKGYVFLYRI